MSREDLSLAVQQLALPGGIIIALIFVLTCFARRAKRQPRSN